MAQSVVNTHSSEEHTLGNSKRIMRTSDLDSSWIRAQRYKIEKGKGVAYLLLSLMVLATILIHSEIPSIMLLVLLNTANGGVVWYAVWKVGFRGIRVDDYLDYEGKSWSSNEGFKIPSYMIQGIILNLTWLSFIILSGTGHLAYSFPIPFIFALELIVFPLMILLKEEYVILNIEAMDWAFIISFAAAALSVLVNGVGVLGFVAAIPVWIGAGLKSLYDAPNWLPSNFGNEADLTSQTTKEAAHKLASMGPLSNSSRVGILMILQGEKNATFTDLLRDTGMAKSSLRSSLDTLLKAGFISSRVVLSSSDRPRTLFEKTERGGKAVDEYTSFMRKL